MNKQQTMRRKKSNIGIMVWVTTLVLGIVACTDDPVFPDPGFDNETDITVDIRRDTADYYDIVLDVDAPNGVNQIQLLDGKTYADIREDFSEYNGKKQFRFNYRVDISDINTDTTLYFIVKIIDNDFRTANKGYVINVKPISFPTIQFNGGDTVKFAAKIGTAISYPIKSLITTGMNGIETVEVLFDDERKIFQQFSDSDNVYTTYALIDKIQIALQENTYHKITFVVTDNKGQVGKRDRYLIAGEVQLPIRIDRYSGTVYRGSYHFTYNDEGKLTQLNYIHDNSTVTDYFSYSYNESGLVDTIKEERTQQSDPLGKTRYYEWMFTYKDGTSEIDEVSENFYVLPYDQVNRETQHENLVLLQNFRYSGFGEIVSVYSTQPKITISFSYQKGFVDGEYINTDFWARGLANYEPSYQTYKIGIEATPIPTYAPYLPQFPIRYYHDDELSLFLYSKYAFNEANGYNYHFETDSEGRLSSVWFILYEGMWNEAKNDYRFIYE